MKEYERVTQKQGEPKIVSKRVYYRLRELEDKIENGTLIELPCKVGDTVYEVIKDLPIQEWEITGIVYGRCYGKNYVITAERKRDFAGWKFWREDFGKTIFLTKAEAEKKLEELSKNP